jgi:hypothetical protein
MMQAISSLFACRTAAGPQKSHALASVSEKFPTPQNRQSGRSLVFGAHRLYYSDARDPASYDHLLGGLKAQMVFTDPPYSVVIDDDFQSANAGILKLDQPALEPFFRNVMNLASRRVTRSGTGLPIATPEAWRGSPDLQGRYDGLVFERCCHPTRRWQNCWA